MFWNVILCIITFVKGWVDLQSSKIYSFTVWKRFTLYDKWILMILLKAGKTPVQVDSCFKSPFSYYVSQLGRFMINTICSAPGTGTFLWWWGRACYITLHTALLATAAGFQYNL